MTHQEALDAICGCAATVTVLSYQEAIESYLCLRDFKELDQVGQTLNFFKSVIKSGESWSPTCEEEFEKAHKNIRKVKND